MSGSLTPGSLDTRLLASARALATPPLAVTCYDELGDLPPFRREVEHVPPVVERLRARLRGADALVVSSPPDGGGIAGPLKRALDWAGADGSRLPTPVAVLNTSITLEAPSAHAALLQALTTLGARIISSASLSIPVNERAFDESGALVDQFAISGLRVVLAFLVDAITNQQRR